MPEKATVIKTNRLIHFNPVMKKLTKPQFEKWFKDHFPDEKDCEAHYNKMHTPVKDKTK